MRRSIAFVLIIALLPAVAIAQSPIPQRSSGKSKWLAIGGVIGGASAAILGTTLGKRSGQTALGASKSPCFGGGLCNVGGIGFGGGPPAGSPCFGGGVCTGGGIGFGGGPPASSPCFGGGVCTVGGIGFGGGPPAGSPCFGGGVCTGGGIGTGGLFVPQHRGTNWKIVGPAIGAAGASAFVLYRSHVAKKRADLSVRPNGVVRLSYTW